ncbi:hypothetical protein IE53DRAFT_390425 [Violaceomyces palustris]|uniref:Uncharacterized protein n=1 Tax=Violaceomyces palustris TaxID=1673888 RepID=A0ACD0NNT2_9BASI|nr:hypothetical protein IE53DRAFT_390425 [Violaceomyces palustris]
MIKVQTIETLHPSSTQPDHHQQQQQQDTSLLTKTLPASEHQVEKARMSIKQLLSTSSPFSSSQTSPSSSPAASLAPASPTGSAEVKNPRALMRNGSKGATSSNMLTASDKLESRAETRSSEVNASANGSRSSTRPKRKASMNVSHQDPDPDYEDEEEEGANLDQDDKKGSTNAAAGSGTKKKKPRVLRRKTDHSIIERRRREKINERLIRLQEIIPACRKEVEENFYKKNPAGGANPGGGRAKKVTKSLEERIGSEMMLEKLCIISHTVDYIIELRESLQLYQEYCQCDDPSLLVQKSRQGERHLASSDHHDRYAHRLLSPESTSPEHESSQQATTATGLAVGASVRRMDVEATENLRSKRSQKRRIHWGSDRFPRLEQEEEDKDKESEGARSGLVGLNRRASVQVATVPKPESGRAVEGLAMLRGQEGAEQGQGRRDASGVLQRRRASSVSSVSNSVSGSVASELMVEEDQMMVEEEEDGTQASNHHDDDQGPEKDVRLWDEFHHDEREDDSSSLCKKRVRDQPTTGTDERCSHHVPNEGNPAKPKRVRTSGRPKAGQEGPHSKASTPSCANGHEANDPPRVTASGMGAKLYTNASQGQVGGRYKGNVGASLDPSTDSSCSSPSHPSSHPSSCGWYTLPRLMVSDHPRTPSCFVNHHHHHHHHASNCHPHSANVNCQPSAPPLHRHHQLVQQQQQHHHHPSLYNAHQHQPPPPPPQTHLHLHLHPHSQTKPHPPTSTSLVHSNGATTHVTPPHRPETQANRCKHHPQHHHRQQNVTARGGKDVDRRPSSTIMTVQDEKPKVQRRRQHPSSRPSSPAQDPSEDEEEEEEDDDDEPCRPVDPPRSREEKTLVDDCPVPHHHHHHHQDGQTLIRVGFHRDEALEEKGGVEMEKEQEHKTTKLDILASVCRCGSILI